MIGRHWDAALVAILGLVAVWLEGCGVSSRDGNDKQKAMQVCPAFTFGDNGFVSQARAGELVVVTCPTDYTYQGPDLECSWVNRFCVAPSSSATINPDNCYNQYNLTLAGHGLQVWPKGIDPTVVPPPSVASQKPSADMPPAQTGPLAWVANASGTLPNSSNAISLGRRLDPGLPSIITPDHLACKDEAYTDLDFESVEVYDGYELDDAYPWSLRYKEIAAQDGMKIDLLVTTDRANISGRPERSGKGSAMGRININASTALPFSFKFVRSNSQEPVALKKVFFTLFDVAGGGDEGNDKEITVDHISEYFLSDQSSVAVTKLENGQYIFGRAQSLDGVGALDTRPVAGAASQLSVKDMWLNSLNRTVVVMFRNTSEFTLYVSVTPGPTGRDFEFTGWSEVASMGQKVFVASSQIEAKFSVERHWVAEHSAMKSANILILTGALVGSAALAVLAIRRHQSHHSSLVIV